MTNHLITIRSNFTKINNCITSFDANFTIYENGDFSITFAYTEGNVYQKDMVIFHINMILDQLTSGTYEEVIYKDRVVIEKHKHEFTSI